MAGKSTGKKGRQSARREASGGRDAKRHKSYGIKQFLQPLPAATDSCRDSSEEPADQLPSQTPALGVAAVPRPAAGADFTVPTAAGAKLQTVLLRSLQHRFATQQALETPAGFGGAGLQSQQAAGSGGGAQQEHQQSPVVSQEGEEDDGDGFQIFSQLTYEPTFLSQRPPGLGAGPEDAQPPGQSSSPLETQTQLLAPNSQLGLQPPHRAVQEEVALAAPAEEEEEWPSSQLLTQHEEPPPAQQPQDEAARRASGISTAGQKTTPALASTEPAQHDGAGPSDLKMFPLFRPRSSHKKLYIVRHGESLYNAAVHARGSSWADPLIFDAALTDRGRQQALALRGKLAALKLPPDTLWVASPLQRALQTLLLACPAAHLLGKGGCGGAENSAANGADGHLHSPPNVVVLPSISEMLSTCGDVGHPASELRKRYPQLDAQLALVPEQWWHCPPGKPNCALTKCFGSKERHDSVVARIGAFRRWLQERPERTIVAVGHSVFWRSFEEVCRGSRPTSMNNCEFRLLHF